MSDSNPSDREVFESIPWEELRDLGDTSRRRRVWYLLGIATVVAVLVFSVVRTFSAPAPQAVVPSAVSSAADPEGSAPRTEPEPDPALSLPPPIPSAMSEADLRAGEDPTALAGRAFDEYRAASFSEWFILDFFTLDGSGPPGYLERWLPGAAHLVEASSRALSYVEWVRALWTEPVADGRWRTVVALRRLVSTDGQTHSRLPTQSVEVVVDLGADMPIVIDLPRFIPLPEANPGQWWLGEEWETPPPAVLRSAREELLLAGAGETVGRPAVSRVGEAWRVEWAVADPVGVSWPVSLWIGPDGGTLPAGG